MHYVMIKLNVFYLSFVLSALVSFELKASNSKAVSINYMDRHIVSFASILRKMTSKSPDLIVAKSVLQIADQRVNVSKSKFFPNLDVSSTSQRTDHLDSSSVTVPSSFSSSTEVSLTLNLYNGGGDIHRLRQSQYGRKQADLRVRRAQFNIALSALELAHKVNQSLLTLRQKELQLSLAKEQFKIEIERYTLGEISTLELERMRLVLERKKIKFLKAKSHHITANASIASVTETENWEEQQWQLYQLSKPYLATLQEAGFEYSVDTYDILNSQSKLEEAYTAKRIVSSLYRPKVSVFYKSIYGSTGALNIGGSFNSQNKVSTSSGITATWNLFSGFSSNAELAESSENIYIARANLYKATKSFRLKCIEISTDLTIAREDLLINSKFLKLAIFEQLVIRKRYFEGRVSVIEVSNVNSSLLVQEHELLKSSEIVSYLEAKFLLSGFPEDCK